MGGLYDATGAQGQAESSLQSGTLDRFRGAPSALSSVAFSREKPARMPVSFPLFSEQLDRALGQGDITVGIAFARADVQQHALGIDVGDLEVQAFAQPQAAGVNGGQANPVIQSLDLSKDLARLLGGKDDRQFELWVGADQLDFRRPGLAEGFFPEEFDGADGLSGSLASEFLLAFQMEEVLAQFFGADQVGCFAVKLAEFADARPVAQDGALGQGQQAQVVKEAV